MSIKIDMITIKHLQMNQLSILNNLQGVDMPLKKSTKPNLRKEAEFKF